MRRAILHGNFLFSWCENCSITLNHVALEMYLFYDFPGSYNWLSARADVTTTPIHTKVVTKLDVIALFSTELSPLAKSVTDLFDDLTQMIKEKAE